MSIAIELTSTLPEPGAGGAARPVDAVGVGVFADRLDDALPDGVDRAFVEAQEFEGRPGQTCTVPGAGGRVVVLLGLGPEDEVEVRTYRRAAAAFARAAHKQTHLAIDVLGSLPDRLDPAAVAQALAEGVMLGSYRYTALKSDPEPSHIESLTVLGEGDAHTLAAIDRGRAVGEAVRLARDLVNQPGGSLTPAAFAARAQELARLKGFDVEVLDRAAIEREKLGGLLGVNRGSTEEPRFLLLSWDPGGEPRGTVALVGKGITFDSGGLSLKPSDSMVGMKGDMAGAAAVIGTMAAVAELAPRLRVVGLCPCVENMADGRAYRPSDVIVAADGTSIEVISTDAEGRLALADALVYAKRYRPSAVVDVATLTGASVVALGRGVSSSLFANDDGLAAELLRAAEESGERLWRMPLFEEYAKAIESQVADLKNSGGQGSGVGTAAAFLQAFTDYPWAHVDMAGMDQTDKPGPRAYLQQGATGYGVRLLCEFLTARVRATEPAMM